jgi:hypothetical protein
MLKRIFVSLSLILMFAIAQTGAVLHEISHYTDIKAPVKQQDKAPHSPICDKCVSYGELAHALDSNFSAPPVIVAVHVVFVSPSYAYTQTLFQAYAARAPPTQLA